jgi:membrane-bound serine protease (ClpP class)
VNLFLDPNIAYLLLLVGSMLGLLALVTPGTGVLELASVICLGLAGYAVTQLDVHWWALVLLIASIIPFIYATRKPKREAYLAFSILGLVIGSAYLFTSDKGWWLPGVNLFMVLLASVIYAGFLWIAIRKSVQAISAPPTHDLAALVGQVGEAKTFIHKDGSVQVAGELWSARSKSPIPAGRQVKVVARDGFILEVESESTRD